MASFTIEHQLAYSKSNSSICCEAIDDLTEISSDASNSTLHNELLVNCPTCGQQTLTIAERENSDHEEAITRHGIIEELAILIAELRRENSFLESRVRSLTSQTGHLNVEIVNLTNTNASLVEQVKQVDDLKMKITDVLLNSSLKCDEQHEKIEALEKEIADLNNSKRDNENAIVDLNSQLEARENEMDLMRKSLQDTRHAYDELFENFENQQVMVEQLQLSLTLYHERENELLSRQKVVDHKARTYTVEELENTWGDEFVSCKETHSASAFDNNNQTESYEKTVAIFNKRPAFADQQVVEKLRKRIGYIEVENEVLKKMKLDAEKEIVNLKQIKQRDDATIKELTEALETSRNHLVGIDDFILQTNRILEEHREIQSNLIPQLLLQIESLKNEKTSLVWQVQENNNRIVENERLRQENENLKAEIQRFCKGNEIDKIEIDKLCQEKLNDRAKIDDLTKQLEISRKLPMFIEQLILLYDLDCRRISEENNMLREELRRCNLEEETFASEKETFNCQNLKTTKVIDFEVVLAL